MSGSQYVKRVRWFRWYWCVNNNGVIHDGYKRTKAGAVVAASRCIQ